MLAGDEDYYFIGWSQEATAEKTKHDIEENELALGLLRAFLDGLELVGAVV